MQWFDTELPGDELSAADSVAQRSIELDRLWEEVESRMSRCPDGLDSESVAGRSERKRRVLSVLGGEESDWEDWQWQVRKIIREPETLSRLIDLPSADYESIVRAREIRLPFGITPYYVSLMDESPDSGHDRAIRAQVLPPPDYVSEMEAHRHDKSYSFDFMRECDTSPIGLVTRRYPAIVILKPFNTCPQICVYCQRNWEIEDAMSPGALASRDDIEAACRWIESHRAIREVLITGRSSCPGRFEARMGSRTGSPHQERRFDPYRKPHPGHHAHADHPPPGLHAGQFPEAGLPGSLRRDTRSTSLRGDA